LTEDASSSLEWKGSYLTQDFRELELFSLEEGNPCYLNGAHDCSFKVVLTPENVEFTTSQPPSFKRILKLPVSIQALEPVLKFGG